MNIRQTTEPGPRGRKCTSPRTLFEDAFDKPVLARFDGAQTSSDGGLALLAALNNKLGFFDAFAEFLADSRSDRRVQHTNQQLLAQRVFAIAAGYSGCKDIGPLRKDSMLRLAAGQREKDLASQPTLSGFERRHSARDVVGMTRRFETFVIDHLAAQYSDAKRVIIDLDGTVDPAYGQQAFSSFNGHYGTRCLFPLLGFLTVDGSTEQHLFHARLRPGTSKEPRVSVALLRRTVKQLRTAFNGAEVLVRLDAGFAAPHLLNTLDELGVKYVVGYPGNKIVDRMAAGHLICARTLAKLREGTCAIFGDGQYQAKTWKRDRRVVFKAEVTVHPGREPRDNARFLLTNLDSRPHEAWDLYVARGDSENRIKELKHDLDIGLTSCSSYAANQFRVLMCAMAYFLLQQLRASMKDTELERAQVCTLRMRLLKVAVVMKESVRRIVLTFPRSYPWQELWCRAAHRIGLVGA